MKHIDLSIVTTMYYSESYIEEFYNRITNAAKKITDKYEIIFVNDGSPDESLKIAISLYKTDSKVKIIDLSRNFGHHKAIMTGLKHAEGEYIFLIDLDLEEQPEELNKFWKELQNSEDTDVIFGVQAKRKGGLFEKISGSMYFLLFNLLSDTKVTKNLLTIRLMTNRYVQSLILHEEREIVLGGLWAITGYNQRSIKLTKLSKKQTTYSIKKKISLLTNSVTSFSNKPLFYIFNFGLFVSSISFLFIFYLIIRKFLFNIASGWTSIISSIFFIGGLILFSIGVVGIYLSKIFTEVKQRPNSIIKNLYNFK